MCNACGMVCCASDAFSGCGCDGCEDPDCWSEDDDPDDDHDEDDVGYRFVCEAVEPKP